MNTLIGILVFVLVLWCFLEACLLFGKDLPEMCDRFKAMRKAQKDLEDIHEQEWKDAQYKPSDKEKGFTLIELMIVVTIVGILMSIALPQFKAYRDEVVKQKAHHEQQQLPDEHGLSWD